MPTEWFYETFSDPEIMDKDSLRDLYLRTHVIDTVSDIKAQLNALNVDTSGMTKDQVIQAALERGIGFDLKPAEDVNKEIKAFAKLIVSKLKEGKLVP